jgi:hypothetical protein
MQQKIWLTRLYDLNKLENDGITDSIKFLFVQIRNDEETVVYVYGSFTFESKHVNAEKNINKTQFFFLCIFYVN